MNENLKVVIFDMDGLLIDTEPFWRQAEMKVFATVGVKLTEEDCLKTTGYRFDEVVEHWYQQQPWTGKTKNEIHDEVLDEMEAFITKTAIAMNGALHALEFFKNKNLRIALASSSAMRLIKATVKRLKIEKYFELLVSAEHERYGKPHPAVFLRTAETLDVMPGNCLVIEDSFFGVLAAKSARMQCLAVPHESQFNDPRFAIADWKLKSLEEIESLWVTAL